MFVKNGTGELKRVLVSRPTYLKPAPINEIAKVWQNTTLDTARMEEEHRLLVKAYEANGVAVEYLEPAENRPNAVFSRDFGACVREGYILGRFKLPLRQFEHVDYERRMAELGVPCVAFLREGYFEGGDFMFMDETHLLIGMADRTDEKGLEELRQGLNVYGYQVIGVALRPQYLHLDMCFNLVDDHLAVAYPGALSEEALALIQKLEIEILDVEEDSIFSHGCNLQSLGSKRVLSLKKNARVNERLAQKGMKVIELDITEILKAGGGPHCMTFPLERG